MMSPSDIQQRIFDIQAERNLKEFKRSKIIEAFTHGFCPNCGSTNIHYSFGLLGFLMSSGKYHCKDCLFTLKIRSWEH